MRYRCQFQDRSTGERAEVVVELAPDEAMAVEVPQGFIGSVFQWQRMLVVRGAKALLPRGDWVEIVGGVFKIIEHGAHAPSRRADRVVARDETPATVESGDRSEGFAMRLLEQAAGK